MDAKSKWIIWAKAVLSAAITGAATAISIMIIDPIYFNFDEGLTRLFTVAGISALFSVANYLKQSPLPK